MQILEKNEKHAYVENTNIASKLRYVINRIIVITNIAIFQKIADNLAVVLMALFKWMQCCYSMNGGNLPLRPKTIRFL